MSASAVQDEIKKDSLRGWLSWSIVALFFFLDYCLKNSIGALGSTLMNDFDMSYEQFGQISAAFPLAYLVLQIPAGILVDKYGPRWLITGASLTCAIGCLLFAKADSYSAMLVGRALIGTGAAFSLVTCSKIAAIWFPPRRFAFLFGIMIMIAFTGAFLGMRSIIPVIDYFGWQDTMYLTALVFVIFSVLMAIIIRDTVDGTPYKTEGDQTIIGLLKEILVVMTSKQSWLLALFAGLMFAPTTVIATWGPQVLADKFHIDDRITPQLTSWLFMGWIVGSPLSGFISDWLGKRKPVMFFSAISTFILCSILIYSQALNENMLLSLMFLIGLASSGFALSFTVLKESYSKDLVGAAMGFMNTMNSLFESGSIILAGYIVSVHASFIGDGTNSLETSFYLIPVCLILSILITPKIKEKSYN